VSRNINIYVMTSLHFIHGV